MKQLAGGGRRGACRPTGGRRYDRGRPRDDRHSARPGSHAERSFFSDTTATPVPTAPSPSIRRRAAGTLSPRCGRTGCVGSRPCVSGRPGRRLTGLAVVLALTGASPKSTSSCSLRAGGQRHLRRAPPRPPRRPRQKLGAFLSRFPGFADQAALETKLDEVLDRLVGDGIRRQADATRRRTSSRVVRRGAGLRRWGRSHARPRRSTLRSPDGSPRYCLGQGRGARPNSWLDSTLEAEGGIRRTPRPTTAPTITVFAAPKIPRPQAALADGRRQGRARRRNLRRSRPQWISTRAPAPISTGGAVSAARLCHRSGRLGFMFLSFSSALMARFSRCAVLGGPSAGAGVQFRRSR